MSSESEEFYSYMYSDINPSQSHQDINFPQKLEFWENKLKQFCMEREKCAFSIDETAEAFVYNDMCPSPFRVVLQNLIENGTVLHYSSLLPLTSPQASFKDYFYGKIYTILSKFKPKNIKNDDIYLYLPLLKMYAQEIVEKFNQTRNHDPFDNILTLKEFNDKCLEWNLKMEQNELIAITAYLQQTERVTICHLDDLMFVKITETPSDIVNETDICAYELKRVTSKHQEVLEECRNEINKFRVEILGVKKDITKKYKLMSLLRKHHKLREKEIKLEGEIFTLEEQLHTLQEAVITSDIIKATTLSTQTLKSFKISEGVDILNEARNQTDDIKQLINGLIISNTTATVDDEQLLEELNKLEFEHNISLLPDVPLSKMPSIQSIDTPRITTSLIQLN